MPEISPSELARDRTQGSVYALGNLALFGLSVHLNSDSFEAVPTIASSYFLVAAAWNIGGILQKPKSD